MRKCFLLILLTGLSCTMCRKTNSSTSIPNDQPNILFVLIDDMGYGDLACYGNAETQTPEIDQLAEEGIRFSQFYVNAPICSPSRVAFTTGQYPSRWGITSYINDRAHNKKRGMKNFLDLDAPSVARALSQNGYYTAHIGKWHMGGGRDVGDAPLITAYGFDESVTQFEGLGERYLATYETLDLEDSTRNLEKWSAALGKGEVHWEKRYEVTEKFVDRAIGAIEHAQNAGKPFYINLWPDDVHTPLEPSPANRGDGSRHDLYLGVVKELDKELGRIFDYIRKDPALAENTMIVLASDNGPQHGVGSAGNLRGHKSLLYEGGIREPFIVWFPGHMSEEDKGSVNEKNVIAGMDLSPTLLSIAGVKHNIKFDGIDASKAFLGEEQKLRVEPIMWQRPPGRNIVRKQDRPDLAIREGAYKLLINTDGSGVELYNIEEDEEESVNLSQKHPEIVKRLSDKVLAWYASMPPIVE